jgi:hypothetical protein
MEFGFQVESQLITDSFPPDLDDAFHSAISGESRQRI